MPLLSAYGLQALTLFVALSVSSPLSAYSKRQDLTLDRCANPDLPSDNRCWKLAEVRNYLINQTTGWIKTTPICDDPTRCCGPAEEWSTCFLRLALGRPGQNCTTVESGSCTVIGGLDPNLHPSIVPQVRYTVQGIYGVNEFYTIYFQGLRSASAQVSQSINGVASLLKNVEPQQLAQNLDRITQLYASAINRALKLLMGDAESFVQLADTEYSHKNAWLEPERPSDVAKTLAPAIRTYLISESMKQTNWYAVALGKSAKPAPSNDPIYWSPSTGRQYRLAQSGKATADPTTLIRDLPAYADLPQLFDGGFNCTAEGRADDELSVILNFDGTPGLSCASALPVNTPPGTAL